MAGSKTSQLPAFRQWRGFGQRLLEISMFFEGTDPVHRTMTNVCGKMQSAGIDYAIIGGMAVNAHRYRRTTADVDFLLSSHGFATFLEVLVPGEFQRVKGRPRRFLDPTTDVTFDILVSGQFPGSGSPGPIAFPEPTSVSQDIDGRQVISLAKLVELKLAAHRYQDFADVVALIREHQLDESFQSQLHAHVHSDFVECLEERRREDEYERRQDEPFRQDDDNGGPSGDSG